MQTLELPNTVRRAWGAEAARDFVNWLDARLVPEAQISSFVARQKVNVLMLEKVSNLLLADKPILVQAPDGSWMWRVPVDLTFPSHSRVGCVGEVEVDARYGEVRYDETLLSQIAEKAQHLAQRVLHPST